MSQHRELFAALSAPIESGESAPRNDVGSSIPVPFPRLLMDRFDAVLGPENWSDDYIVAHDAVICRLTIRLPDGAVVTKCGAASRPASVGRNTSDENSFVRAWRLAATKFGVGRSVAGDGVAELEREAQTATPKREAEKLDRSPASASTAPTSATPSRALPAADDSGSPRTGRALFAWTRQQDKTHQFGLLDYLSEWAKERRYPSRMVDWDGGQVAEAYAEACVKLRGVRRMQGGAAPAMAN
jgi:hypothetical protein